VTVPLARAASDGLDELPDDATLCRFGGPAGAVVLAVAPRSGDADSLRCPTPPRGQGAAAVALDVSFDGGADWASVRRRAAHSAARTS
jgi:hypothetical protein